LKKTVALRPMIFHDSQAGEGLINGNRDPQFVQDNENIPTDFIFTG